MVLHTVYTAILFLLVLAIPSTVLFSVDGGHFNLRERNPKRCSYSKDHGMISADCYDLDLTEIPQNLRTDIELLQATHNRIRDLYRDSFNRYPYLRVLYLDDNMISYIQNGTFDSLQNLEVIRLSQNALDRVPAGVLQLPNIRKIFADDNRLISGGGLVEAPTRETLVSLTLAKCHLEELPPLEMFPNLVELNVSANNLKRILPEQLASTCQLQFLDISRNPKLSQDINGDGCACHLLASWIADKNIILQVDYSLNCTSKVVDFAHCGNMSEAEEIYNACMSSVIAKAEAIKARNTWILVGCILASIIATGPVQCSQYSNSPQTGQSGVGRSFPQPFRLVLGPTHSPTHWVPEHSSKQSGWGVALTTHPYLESRSIPLSPSAHSWQVIG